MGNIGRPEDQSLAYQYLPCEPQSTISVDQGFTQPTTLSQDTITTADNFQTAHYTNESSYSSPPQNAFTTSLQDPQPLSENRVSIQSQEYPQLQQTLLQEACNPSQSQTQALSQSQTLSQSQVAPPPTLPNATTPQNEVSPSCSQITSLTAPPATASYNYKDNSEMLRLSISNLSLENSEPMITNNYDLDNRSLVSSISTGMITRYGGRRGSDMRRVNLRYKKKKAGVTTFIGKEQVYFYENKVDKDIVCDI